MRYRFTVALLAGLISVACASCSTGDGPASSPFTQTKSTANEQPEQADLQVTEAGETSGLYYAYVRNNEDREVAAEVEFTGYDAEGNAYKESAATKSDSKSEVFPPKSTIAVALSVVMEKKGGVWPDITKADARLIPKKRSEIPDHKPGKFEAAALKADQWGVVESDPVITNGYPQAVKSGVVVLMCKSAEGKVTYAGSTQFSMPANVTEKIDMAGLQLASGPVASCVAYPRISDNTSFRNG